MKNNKIKSFVRMFTDDQICAHALRAIITNFSWPVESQVWEIFRSTSGSVFAPTQAIIAQTTFDEK